MMRHKKGILSNFLCFLLPTARKRHPNDGVAELLLALLPSPGDAAGLHLPSHHVPHPGGFCELPGPRTQRGEGAHFSVTSEASGIISFHKNGWRSWLMDAVFSSWNGACGECGQMRSTVLFWKWKASSVNFKYLTDSRSKYCFLQEANALFYFSVGQKRSWTAYFLFCTK